MQLSVRTKEFEALIRLLDDPDNDIYRNVSDKLVSIGRNAIPLLEYEWESNINSGIQNRIEDIIHQIEFDDCKSAMHQWVDNGASNLLTGALTVSRFQYPEQEIDSLLAIITQLRKDVWLELNDNLTSLEKVRVINHILFDVHGFAGDMKYQTSMQNSFINNVLELRKASPTSMSILYKILADQLELPIQCLNLPGHLVLAYMDMNYSESNDILFYINPFSKGAVFGRGELDRYIERMEIPMDIADLHPLSNLKIIERSLAEIRAHYNNAQSTDRSREVDLLIEIVAPNK